MTESTAANVAHELAIEQAHVDKVYDCLEKAADEARNVARESRARFTSDRTDWHREEVGTALFERDAFAYQAAKRLASLDAQYEGLVFGRLDFSDDDEVRYIGRLGVRDDDYEPLVIDWRAPAAEPFYRATAQDPMSVARRRVLRCKGERVIGIEDDLLDESADDLVVVGEGSLMAALKRSRGPKMRDIVATIQAEQDEAIRAPYKGVTVISGGPGTGKTVVALHRAAFLLYTYRKRLQQGGVLVVGPTDIFMTYIERVLPGLGEDSVTLKSMGMLASDVLDFGSTRAEDRDSAEVKGSLAMLPVLRRAVREPITEAMILRVSVKGEILTVQPDELAKIRRDVLASHKMNQASTAVSEALLQALWSKLSDQVAALLDLNRELFDEIVTSQASWTMFLHGWWPVLEPEQVLARLADPAFCHKVAANDLDADQQHVLMESLAHARGYLPGRPHPDWSISDIALLDELAHMLGPAPHEEPEDPTLFLEEGNRVSELVTIADRLTDRRVIPADEPISTYAHVLVDESQDVTPMQWRMLRRRGPQASWTLVGDPAQSSYPHHDETERVLRELVGRGESRRFRLTKNYRSPAEVMELGAKVITAVDPDADLPEAVRHTGIAPVLLDTSPRHLSGMLSQAIRDLASQVEGSIAVITPPGRFESIRDTVATMAVDHTVSERLRVITALESKGLEFDAVIVVAPDEIVEQSAGATRVLYVALTRPTQRLVTLDVLRPDQRAVWKESLE